MHLCDVIAQLWWRVVVATCAMKVKLKYTKRFLLFSPLEYMKMSFSPIQPYVRS